MERRVAIIVVVAVILAAAASTGAVYAYIAETINSDNDYNEDPITIRVLNKPDTDPKYPAANKAIKLTTINLDTDVSGTGPWIISEGKRATSIDGYLDIKCPDNITEQNPAKMRVWIEMEELESWTLVESVFLNIYVDGKDNSPKQYKLFGSDSELEEVAGEPNRVDIDVQTWTGSGAKYFVLTMKLKDSLGINPNMIPHDSDNILLKNSVYFTSGVRDPVVPLKVKYYVTDPNSPAVIQSAYQGNILEQPAAPAGYRVEGWYTEYDDGPAGRQWIFSSDHLDKEKDGLVKEDGFWTLKLYAKYSPIQYSIVCHYPDGTVIGDVPVHYNVESDPITLPTPTLANYTFSGWSGTDIEGKEMTVVIGTGSTGDREYTANWSYQITFHANGGTGTMDPQSMDMGKYDQLKQNAFTYVHKIFYGWSESQSGEIKYLDMENVIDLGDTDLYAIWGDYLSITYTSANPEDGTPPAALTELTPKMVKTVSAQEGLTKQGFIGWIDSSSGTFYAPYSSIEVGTTNITLEAVYSDCTVVFDRNEGSGSMSEQRISSAVYLPLKPNTFTKTGYAFYGWNTESNGTGTYYGDEDMISPAIGVTTITLYAIWGHSIEYDGNGGTGDAPSDSVVKADAAVVVKAKPSNLNKAGCTFKGWNTMADGTGDDYSGGETIASLTSNITLYAVWECTVTFRVVDDTVNPQEPPYDIVYKVVAGTTVQLPSDITYLSHTLTAWDSGGTLYLPGRNVVIEGSMIFTSVWADVVTVTFNHGTGGTGEMTVQTVMKGVRTALNTNEFINASKAFYGWSATDGGALLYKDEQIVTLDADITLYAVWKNYVSFTIASSPDSIEEPGIVFLNDDLTLNSPYMDLDGYSVIWYKEDTFVNEFVFKDESGEPSVFPSLNNYTLYGKVFVNVYFICSGQRDKIDQFPYGIETQIASKDLFNNQQCWNTRSDGSGTYYAKNAYLTVTSPLGMYAMMSSHSNSFTVSFNKNGGDSGEMSNQTGFVPGDTQLTANAFTKTGYVFYKWNTAADGSGTWFGDESRAMISKDITLYAIWKYKVNYNGNGSDGGTSVPSQDVEPNGSVQVSACTFTKTGMSFYKWNTAFDGSGDDYFAGDTITLTSGDVTLYAVWAYAITFNINGGEGTVPGTMYCLSGKTITIPDSIGFSKANYAFYQWNTNEQATGTFYPANTNVSFNQEVTLYAIWGHSVTYLAPDATGGEDVKVVSTRANSVAADDGSSISRDGYTFRYWTTGEHGTGTSYIGGAKVPTTANITLYAQWNVITYTISYELNGGTADPAAPSSYDTTAAKELKNPSKNGFRFAGWSGPDLNGCNNTAVTIPAGSLGNRTYTAHWEQYTVSFDSNGGYGVMPDQALITGTLNANTFAKKGHTFSGWKDGSGNPYSNQQSVTLEGNLTLYAQWTVVTYSITYNNNGATVEVTTPANYNVTTANITLGIPEKTDFTFGGWYDNAGFTGDPVKQIPKGSMDNRIFYAKWESNPQL